MACPLNAQPSPLTMENDLVLLLSYHKTTIIVDILACRNIDTSSCATCTGQYFETRHK